MLRPTRLHLDEGSASVELIAVIPMLALALLIAAQFALTGAALWDAAIAARSGARAAKVGGSAQPAALRALPPTLRSRAEISDRDGVRVRVAVPGLLSALPALTVGARSSLEQADGAAK